MVTVAIEMHGMNQALYAHLWEKKAKKSVKLQEKKHFFAKKSTF